MPLQYPLFLSFQQQRSFSQIVFSYRLSLLVEFLLFNILDIAVASEVTRVNKWVDIFHQYIVFLKKLIKSFDLLHSIGQNIFIYQFRHENPIFHLFEAWPLDNWVIYHETSPFIFQRGSCLILNILLLAIIRSQIFLCDTIALCK